MLPIQFRIHKQYADVSGLLVSVFDKCAQGFLFEHDADEEVHRTHVHGYMFQSTICRKSLSEHIKKKFNLKGNEDFFTSDKSGRRQLSQKAEIDMSGAYWYGSRAGTIAPSFLHNISPALLEELQGYARKNGKLHNIERNSPNTEIIVIKEVKTRLKPTQYQHVNIIVNRINDLNPDLHSMSLTQRQRITFDLVYQYFQQNELFMGKYKQLDFLDNVLLRLGDVDYKKTLFSDFAHRTSRTLV